MQEVMELPSIREISMVEINGELMTREETAESLGLSIRKIDVLAHDGELKRVCGRITTRSVARWIDREEQKVNDLPIARKDRITNRQSKSSASAAKAAKQWRID